MRATNARIKYRLNVDGSYIDYNRIDELRYQLKQEMKKRREQGDTTISISIHSWKDE